MPDLDGMDDLLDGTETDTPLIAKSGKVEKDAKNIVKPTQKKIGNLKLPM